MNREEWNRLKRPQQMGLMLEDLLGLIRETDGKVATGKCGPDRYNELKDILKLHMAEMNQSLAISPENLLRSKELTL